MKHLLKAVVVLALAVILYGLARADTTTTKFGFIIPTTGSTGYVNKVNDWVIKIDTGVAGLNIADTFTSSITMTGAGGNILSGSSVTASAFFGNGSGLTGIASAGANTTFTGLNTFSGSGANGLVVTSSLTSGGYNILGAWSTFTPSVTGSGSMTITGLDTTSGGNSYTIIGKTMCMNIYLLFGTGGTPSTDVALTIPAGKSPQMTYSRFAAWGFTNSVQTAANCYANGTTIDCSFMPAANWAAAGDGLAFATCFPIN